MPGTPAIMPGCTGGLYLNTGTYGTPVWTEQVLVKDVKFGSPWTFAKAQDRSTPIDLYVKAKVDIPIQVVMRADPGAAEYASWVDCHWDRSGFFDALCLNGKATQIGASGVRGPYLVSMGDEPQEIEGVVYDTFDLKPTKDTLGNVPKSALVTDDDGDPLLAYTAITY